MYFKCVSSFEILSARLAFQILTQDHISPNKKRRTRRPFYLATVDNNDTVLYGCIRVALELQPSEENATLMKRVRQIGIRLTVL